MATFEANSDTIHATGKMKPCHRPRRKPGAVGATAPVAWVAAQPVKGKSKARALTPAPLPLAGEGRGAKRRRVRVPLIGPAPSSHRARSRSGDNRGRRARG